MIWYEYKGMQYTLADLAEEAEVKKSTMRARLERHTVEEAMAMPNKRGGKAWIKVEWGGKKYTFPELSKMTGKTTEYLRQHVKRKGIDKTMSEIFMRKESQKEADKEDELSGPFDPDLEGVRLVQNMVAEFGEEGAREKLSRRLV